MATKNLGPVTAYRYAVAGGYTGTEAEFTALLGDLADEIENLEGMTVTVTTGAAGSSASASYNHSTGVLALTIPRGDTGKTAYAYARDEGYTGTESEFSVLMGNVADGSDIITDLTASAETGLPGSSASATFDRVNNDIHFVIPEGVPGSEQHGLYGAKWNRVTNQLTRTRDAADITTDTTNFCHKGSKNSNYNNPFDSIYPWSDIFVCDVDLTKYTDSVTSLEDSIVSTYGDPDFTYEGSSDLFVGCYIPEFWYKSIVDSTGVEFLISQNERAGFQHSEKCIRGISFCVDAGNSKVTSGSGVPLTNIAVSQIHARANNSGFNLCDIYDIDSLIVLYLVEYANMNAQAAIGNGCDSCSRENDADTIASVTTDAAAGTTTITIDDSALSSVIYVGTQVDIGTSKGAVTYRGIIKDYSVSGTVYTIVLDRVLSGVTTGMYATFHGFSACEFNLLSDSVGNASGYIGANDKANAYYRGMVLYANRYAYVLGIYRQQTTNHLWLCPKTKNTQSYDELNTTDHIDTGVALPVMASAAWLTVGGNAQSIPGLSGFMATDTSSGSSSSPVGDQQYVPVNTAGNTILLFGGSAAYGWDCGMFCGSWGNGAGVSYWTLGGFPILKNKSV